jgi:hypothetical protein
VNLNLLDLVSILSDLLVLVHVLDLKLALYIKLEGFDQILAGVLNGLPFIWVSRWVICLFQESIFVLVELVLNLVLNIIEVERRNTLVHILSNLDLNFFLRIQFHLNLDNGLQARFLHHVLDIALHSRHVETWLHHLWLQRVDLGSRGLLFELGQLLLIQLRIFDFIF